MDYTRLDNILVIHGCGPISRAMTPSVDCIDLGTVKFPSSSLVLSHPRREASIIVQIKNKSLGMWHMCLPLNGAQ